MGNIGDSSFEVLLRDRPIYPADARLQCLLQSRRFDDPIVVGNPRQPIDYKRPSVEAVEICGEFWDIDREKDFREFKR